MRYGNSEFFIINRYIDSAYERETLFLRNRKIFIFVTMILYQTIRNNVKCLFVFTVVDQTYKKGTDNILQF